MGIMKITKEHFSCQLLNEMTIKPFKILKDFITISIFKFFKKNGCPLSGKKIGSLKPNKMTYYVNWKTFMDILWAK